MGKETPMADELEKGPWPSFVKQIKRAAKKHPSANDLLNVVELSYKVGMAVELLGGTRTFPRSSPTSRLFIPSA